MMTNKKRKGANFEVPSIEQLQAELKRERYQNQYGKTLRSTVYILIVVAAMAILVATLWLPVFRMYGSSMTPVLHDGDIVISLKTSDYQQGDVIAFYYNNKILVKRVIALPGELVDIERDGTVYVDNLELSESYVDKKAYGDCNIDLPYQVPESRVFVMGDHREISIDSRNTSIGCVAEEQIVGKLVFCVWPIDSFGAIN